MKAPPETQKKQSHHGGTENTEEFLRAFARNLILLLRILRILRVSVVNILCALPVQSGEIGYLRRAGRNRLKHNRPADATDTSTPTGKISMNVIGRR